MKSTHFRQSEDILDALKWICFRHTEELMEAKWSVQIVSCSGKTNLISTNMNAIKNNGKTNLNLINCGDTEKQWEN